MNKEDRYETYQLKFPLEFGEQVITEIKFRRPQGKHLWPMPLLTMTDFQPIRKLAAELSGLPPKVFEIMEGEDVGAVNVLVQGFLSVMNPSFAEPPLS